MTSAAACAISAPIEPTYFAADGKIICQIDNAAVHSIQLHLKQTFPDWTLARYVEAYPNAPLLSEAAKIRLAAGEQSKAASKIALVKPVNDSTSTIDFNTGTTAFFHEVFELGNADAAFSMSKGRQPINITVFPVGGNEATLPYVSEIDRDYVFNIDLIKLIIVGFELNKPIYLWGFHGTGKTTVLEQCAARTGRHFMRVQHTINTEESHILGQYVVKNGGTEFQLGPLPLAMIHGMIYCADEYDFAMPSVSAVYQAVLEGKPLIIKEAPPEYRVIRPHPNFRFTATGNTNGIGDETGLYQGTLIQNAANFSRFPITEEVEYMDPKIEEAVVIQKTGIDKSNAAKIVRFAKEVRQSFADGKIGMPVSPRELVNATTLAIAFGGKMEIGIKVSYANRLSRIDKKAVLELAQRIFGS